MPRYPARGSIDNFDQLEKPFIRNIKLSPSPHSTNPLAAFGSRADWKVQNKQSGTQAQVLRGESPFSHIYGLPRRADAAAVAQGLSLPLHVVVRRLYLKQSLLT